MPRVTFPQLIKRLIPIIFALLLIFHPGGAISQEDCGDCDNPLVEVMNSEVDGDVPEFKEWHGWKEAKEGDPAIGDQMQRAFEFLLRFIKQNPCADLYHIIVKPEGGIVRTGVKTGNKKYEIRSKATIKNAEPGEKALVRHIITKRTELAEPIHSPGGSIQYYDVEETYNELELVPLKAQVSVIHKLVALKNGETYDTGTDLLDWVDDPPGEDSDYFPPDDGEITVDGITVTGNDGILSGSMPPSVLASMFIHLDKGDVGVTIRKKETPSSLSLDVDDSSEFPPYYKLKISDIKNQFNETVPNNVKVALKVQKGDLEGGEMMDGWNVFTSTGGKINDEILYTPPQCSDAKEDILEVAGICDYHDGPESVGEQEFTKKIPNSQCYDATLTIYGDLIISKKESHDDTSWDTYEEYRTYDETIHAAVIYNLKMINSADMFMFGEYWEYYQPQARNISSFNASVRDKRYEYGYAKETGIGFETTVTITGNGMGQKIISPMVTNTIIIAYDKKTKKAKRIVSCGADIEYKMNITEELDSVIYNRDSGDKPTRETTSKVSDKKFELQPVNDAVKGPAGNTYPEFQVSSGDGLKAFGGFAKVTSDTSGDDCYWYDTCHEEKSFRWSFSRQKQKK